MSDLGYESEVHIPETLLDDENYSTVNAYNYAAGNSSLQFNKPDTEDSNFISDQVLNLVEQYDDITTSNLNLNSLETLIGVVVGGEGADSFDITANLNTSEIMETAENAIDIASVELQDFLEIPEAIETLGYAIDGYTSSALRIEQAGTDAQDAISTFLNNLGQLPQAEGEFQMPDVVLSGVTDSDNADFVLGDGALGAFVPASKGGGENGTIVLDRELVSTGSAEIDGQAFSLEDVAMEELGEAIAEHAANSGISVADGDVGARIVKIAQGEDLIESDFEALTTDTTTVTMSDGTVVVVSALYVESSYDITEGNYNTDGDDETSELNLSPTTGTTTTASVDDSQYSLDANDLTLATLEDAIIDDFDDALDGAFNFSGQSFFVDASGDIDPDAFTSLAISELQDATADVGSVFNNIQQMSYGLEQIIVNLDDRYYPEFAQSVYDNSEARILEALAFEYNSALGNTGDDVVEFTLFDDAIEVVLDVLETGVGNLADFIWDISDTRDAINDNQTEETWLNSVLQVGSALVGAGTGLGLLRSMSTSAAALEAGTANTSSTAGFLDGLQNAMIGVGVNMGFSGVTVDDLSSTDVIDFSTIIETLSESSEEVNEILLDMAEEGTSDTPQTFYSFGNALQSLQRDIAYDDPSLASNVGYQYVEPDGSTNWRTISSNDAFSDMAEDLVSEASYASGLTIWPFPSRSGDMYDEWTEAAEAQEASRQRSEDFVAAYDPDFADGSEMGIVVIPKLFRSEYYMTKDENQDPYEFATKMNVDLY